MTAGTPTLRTLLADPALALRLVGGEGLLDRAVRWAAPSELLDPTPFLEGGELLLTTGMGLDGADLDDYAARLASCGVAGLGFGVGLVSEVVPGGLVAACEQYALPLLEVPRPTPFVAVAKAVSAQLAAAEHLAAEAQRRLVRVAAGSEGAPGLVRTLARTVSGIVWLLRPDLTVLHCSPHSAAGGLGGVDLNRLLTAAPPASSRTEGPDGELLAHSLGAGSLRGVLVVRCPAPLGREARALVANAAVLASLLLERAATGAGRDTAGVVLRVLLAGQPDLGRAVADDLGVHLPAEPWRVVVVSGTARVAGLPDALVVRQRHRTVALVTDGSLPLELSGGATGVSRPARAGEVAPALLEAEQAAEQAARTGTPVVRADAAPTLRSLLPPRELADYAAARLAPLVEHPDPALLVSLRVWLAHHGQYDPSAVELGVHRHTLRRRVRRAAELLGADLDDPGVRAELWLALSAVR